MAIGLEQLSQRPKTTSLPHPARVHHRPWQGPNQITEVEAEQTVSEYEKIASVREQETPDYAQIGKLAVERAQAIVQRNEEMLQQIYNRRLGQDFKMSKQQEIWDKKEEELFYLNDFSWEVEASKEDSLLAKLKKLLKPKH